MLLLWWMGRDWICFCGTVKLWQNEVFSYENSQHIADWYTFSHILHGILAYAVLTRFWPKTSCQTRFAIGVASAIAWEIIENTNFVIVAMMAGFFLARHLPIYLGVVLALLLEGSMMFFIRDGLALSTMMLIWPIDAVRMWQFGG